MAEIVINIPDVKPHDLIEIEARINGEKRVYHYRVEMFAWEDCAPHFATRALCLKEHLSHYDEHWQLAQIGAATEKSVQVLFRQKA